MHFLRVLYYQSYLFYKKGWTSITKYDDISLTTFYSVSSIFSIPIAVIAIAITVLLGLSDIFTIVIGITIALAVQGIIWCLLYRRGKWKQIVEEKPSLLNNRKFSAGITIFCHVVSIFIVISLFFLGHLFNELN